ncbi:MAG: outer membrane lipoprotein-sorting protein [Sulfuricella sp.]|nr:outer membrane lipoprotein-sorting protein [Sulfuricella sp.]
MARIAASLLSPQSPALSPALLLIGLIFGSLAHADAEVAALLKKADAFRLPAQAVRVETLVELYRDGALDKERRYTVYVKPGRRSLVLMKSPLEAGQKVLMLAEQFWLLMPDTQRPFRITASQKLLGEAAVGDVASMAWGEDYDGQVVGETEIDGHRCLHLDLAATRPGTTYARVELYLDKADKQPRKADLYVNSGKRAKEARFEINRVDGQLRVTSMTLHDDIQTNRRTVVHYQSITPKDTPDAFFNPAALVRNSLAGW